MHAACINTNTVEISLLWTPLGQQKPRLSEKRAMKYLHFSILSNLHQLLQIL